MSDVARFWVLILVVAAGTYLLRTAPILLHGRTPLPRSLSRLLSRVPAAALAALVVPGALYASGGSAYDFSPARIVAAVGALVVAVRTRSVILTLAVGMLLLWSVRSLAALFG